MTTLCLAAGANHSLFLIKDDEKAKPVLDKLLSFVPVDNPDDEEPVEDPVADDADGKKRKAPAGRGRGRGRPKRGKR